MSGAVLAGCCWYSQAQKGMGKGRRQYVVERLLDMKWENGKQLFLVKWEGYDKPEHNTWEPVKSFRGV